VVLAFWASGCHRACLVAAASCWQDGFAWEDCCAPVHGPGGNAGCWDEVFTFSTCCGDGPADGDVSGTSAFQLAASATALGCDGDFFSRFRQLALHYYTAGRLRPALTDLLPRVIANFESRYELCAPGALQALLLRLEDGLPLQAPEVSLDRVIHFTAMLLVGIEEGQFSGSEAMKWPLVAGVERVRQANLQRIRHRAGQRAGSDLGRQRLPNVALAISYCGEPLRWINATIRRRVSRVVDLVIIQKCPGVDIMRALPPGKRLFRSVEVIDVEDLPLRGDECSAYLGYLAQRYERLPPHMVFIHPDAPEHIGAIGLPNILDDTLHALLRHASIPFAHLGSNRVTMRWDPFTMDVLWRGLFGSSVVPGPGVVRTYCCSHFVVARERVWLRPKSFYDNALRFMTSPLSYYYLPGVHYAWARDMRQRLVCQNMMFVWHAIFGEGLDQPHRMFDRELPLFLKGRGIRTAYMNLE